MCSLHFVDMDNTASIYFGMPWIKNVSFHYKSSNIKLNCAYTDENIPVDQEDPVAHSAPTIINNYK